jgi:hypothetical protein
MNKNASISRNYIFIQLSVQNCIQLGKFCSYSNFIVKEKQARANSCFSLLKENLSKIFCHSDKIRLDAIKINRSDWLITIAVMIGIRHC